MERFTGKTDGKAFKNKFFGSLSSDGDEEIDKILEKKSSKSGQHSKSPGNSSMATDSQLVNFPGSDGDFAISGSSQESLISVSSEEKAPVPKLLLKSPEEQKTVRAAVDSRIRNPFAISKVDTSKDDLKRKMCKDIFDSSCANSDSSEPQTPRPDKKKKKTNTENLKYFDKNSIKEESKSLTENKDDSNAEKDTPENKCKCDTEKDQSLEDLLKDDDDDMFADCELSNVESNTTISPIIQYTSKQTSPKSKTSPMSPIEKSKRDKTEASVKSEDLPSPSVSNEKHISYDDSKLSKKEESVSSRAKTTNSESLSTKNKKITSRSEKKNEGKGDKSIPSSTSLDRWVVKTPSRSKPADSPPPHSEEDRELLSLILKDEDLDSIRCTSPDIFKSSQSQDVNINSEDKYKSSSQDKPKSKDRIVKKERLQSPDLPSSQESNSSKKSSQEKKSSRYRSRESPRKKPFKFFDDNFHKSSQEARSSQEKQSSVDIKPAKKKTFKFFDDSYHNNSQESSQEKKSKKYLEENLLDNVNSQVQKSSHDKTEGKKDTQSQSTKYKVFDYFGSSEDEKESSKKKVEKKDTEKSTNSEKDKSDHKSKRRKDPEEKSSSQEKHKKESKSMKEKETSTGTKKTSETIKKDKSAKSDKKKLKSNDLAKSLGLVDSEEEDRKENIRNFTIPKLNRTDSEKSTASNKPSTSTARNRSTAKKPTSFFGGMDNRKVETGPSGLKFFKKEDVAKEEVLDFKYVKDEKTGKLIKVKMDPKEIKKRSKKIPNCNLGPEGQAILDYCYGVHDKKKKEEKWVPPPSSDEEEAGSSEQQGGEKSKKQSSILSFMTLRHDDAELKELLKRDEPNDGIDIKEILRKNKELDEANQRRVKEMKAQERQKRKERERYEDENIAYRDRLEADLTFDKITEYFKEFHPICEEIKRGDAEWCWRHTQFESGNKQGLLYRQILDPFTSDQVEHANRELMKVYMRNREEWFANNHYCDNVLLPEFLVWMYMQMFNLERDDAAERIRNTPLKPEDDFKGVFTRKKHSSDEESDGETDKNKS